jgi:hypothetical protein
LRVSDQCHLEITAAFAVERQVPGDHPVAPMFARFDPETIE